MIKVLQINFDFHSPEIRIEGADFTSCNGLHAGSEPAGLVPAFWLQIHRPEDLDKERPEHIDWLVSKHDFPVFVNSRTAELAGDYGRAANWIPLPLADLDRLWRWPFPVAYGSTFSYQIALAIFFGYDVIDMRDVKLRDDREKWLEAPNMLLWAGEAHRRGIDVLLGEDYTYEFKYGQEERLTNIPGWAPSRVVNDMFPGWSRETRALHDAWRLKNYSTMDNS